MRTCSARSVLREHEVVDQPAVAGERLGAHAGERGLDVARLRARARSARRRARTPSAAPRGAARSTPVRHQRASIRQVPGQRERVEQVAAAHACAGGRRRARRPSARSARSGPRRRCACVRCTPRNGSDGVGHGVDQRAHEVRGARAPGAGRRRGRARSAGRGRRPRRPPGGRPRRRRRRPRGGPRSRRASARGAARARASCDALHLAAGRDRAARLEHVPRVGARRRRAKSAMPGVGRVQAGDPARVRLELLDARGVDPAQAAARRWPVPRRSSSSRRAELARRRSRRSPCRSARWRSRARSQYSYSSRAPSTHSRAFSEPGRVVDAGVDHARVVAGLVGRELGLALEHADRRRGSARESARARRPARRSRRRRPRDRSARAAARACGRRSARGQATPRTAPGPPGAVAAAASSRPGAVQAFVAAAAELARGGAQARGRAAAGVGWRPSTPLAMISAAVAATCGRGHRGAFVAGGEAERARRAAREA